MAYLGLASLSLTGGPQALHDGESQHDVSCVKDHVHDEEKDERLHAG